MWGASLARTQQTQHVNSASMRWIFPWKSVHDLWIMQELRYIFISDSTHLFSCRRPCSVLFDYISLKNVARLTLISDWHSIQIEFLRAQRECECNGTFPSDLTALTGASEWMTPFSRLRALLLLSLRVTFTLFVSKVKLNGHNSGWLGIDKRLICQFRLATVCSDALFAAIKCPNTWIYWHRWVFRAVEQIKFTSFTAKIKDKLYYLEIVNYTTYIVFL